MALPVITVESFNGHDINDATYGARLSPEGDDLARDSELVLVLPLDRYPRYARGNLKERWFTVQIVIATPTLAEIEQLETWFKPKTQGALVVSFDGTSRVVDAVVKSFRPVNQRNQGIFVAQLCAPDPRWRSTAVVSTPNTVNTNPESWDVTNAGTDDDDQAVIKIQVKQLKLIANSWRYYEEVIFANRADRGLNNYMIDLTDGGWDHAAEVAASRSLASGNDVRALYDGVETPRWIGGGGWNSTTARVVINGTWSPGFQNTFLLSNITNVSPANGADLEVMAGGTSGWNPEGGRLVNFATKEVIRYAGVTRRNANGKEAFTGITRGDRGTTAAAGTAGDQLYFVEHRLQIMHGYDAAAAPDARDDLKPMQDLVNSTNHIAHVWASFRDDANPGRSGSWEPALVSRDTQAGKVLAVGGSPATDMRCKYRYDGPYGGFPNANTWRYSFPLGLAANTAPSVRSLGDVSESASGTTLTLDNALGVQPGDLLVAHVERTADVTAVRTGWTEADTRTASAGVLRSSILWKIASVADAAAASFAITLGGTTAARGRITCIKHAHRVAPISDADGASSASATSIAVPTMTGIDNGRVFVFYSNSSERNYTQGAGVTESYDDNDASPAFGLSGGYDTAALTSSAATGTRTGTFTAGAATPIAGHGLVIAPMDALVMTREVDGTMALITHVTDVDGNQFVASTNSGPVASGSETLLGQDRPINQVEFYTRSQVVLSNPDGFSTNNTTAVAGTPLLQKFSIPADGPLNQGIAGVRLPLAGAAGTEDPQVSIRDETGASSDYSSLEQQSNTPNAKNYYSLKFDSPCPVLEGVKYTVRVNAPAGTVTWYGYHQTYEGALTVREFDLLSTNMEFGDFAKADDDDESIVDGVTGYHEPDNVPYVSMGARQDGYWLNGVLENTETAQTITFAILCKDEDVIEINVGTGQERNATTDEPVGYGVTYSDEDDRFTIIPGANTLEWTEAGLVELLVTVEHYNRWH